MKNILNKVVAILMLTVILFSCKKDKTEEENRACMEYVDIHEIANDARFMYFIDDIEGWIIADESSFIDVNLNNAILLHTTDGGKNWSIINNNLNFGIFSMFANGSHFNFKFIDNNKGYIALNILPMDGYGENELYYYTTDKGASWNAIQPPADLVDIIDNSGLGVNSTQMVFAMKDRYVGENDYTNRMYFVSKATNAITNMVILPDGYDYNVNDIHFTDAGVINMSASINDQNYMAHSTDFGVTWSFTAIEYPSSFGSLLDFPTDQVGYLPVDATVYSENQPFYKTTDGGATWLKKTPSHENSLSYTHFSFADANNGLATKFLNSGLYKTTDGGDSWSRVSCFTDKDYSFDISTTPIAISYLAKDKGVVLSNWQNIDYEDIDDYLQNRVYFYTGQ